MCFPSPWLYMADLPSPMVNLAAPSVTIRFTNNVLSTAQQVWLRKLGGAKPVVNEDASGIITAGRAKRVGSETARMGDRSVFFILRQQYHQHVQSFSCWRVCIHRFRQLKEEEKKKLRKASPTENVQTSASDSDDDGSEDEQSTEKVLNCDDLDSQINLHIFRQLRCWERPFISYWTFTWQLQDIDQSMPFLLRAHMYLG